MKWSTQLRSPAGWRRGLNPDSMARTVSHQGHVYVVTVRAYYSGVRHVHIHDNAGFEFVHLAHTRNRSTAAIEAFQHLT